MQKEKVHNPGSNTPKSPHQTTEEISSRRGVGKEDTQQLRPCAQHECRKSRTKTLAPENSQLSDQRAESRADQQSRNTIAKLLCWKSELRVHHTHIPNPSSRKKIQRSNELAPLAVSLSFTLYPTRKGEGGELTQYIASKPIDHNRNSDIGSHQSPLSYRALQLVFPRLDNSTPNIALGLYKFNWSTTVCLWSRTVLKLHENLWW